MDTEPGDTIWIKINGRDILTTFDKNGTQRLPSNKLLRYLVDMERIDLNEVKVLECNGMITEEDRRQLYQMIGYSVSGYWDVFENDEIENPLWDKEEEQ